jgi:hypothetical protein
VGRATLCVVPGRVAPVAQVAVTVVPGRFTSILTFCHKGRQGRQPNASYRSVELANIVKNLTIFRVSSTVYYFTGVSVKSLMASPYWGG